jgi:hypothetical protein
VQGVELLVRDAQLGQVLEESAVLGDQEVLERAAKLLVGNVRVGVGQLDVLVLVVEVGTRELDILAGQ